MKESYSEITVMPREVGVVIFADAPSHPNCQYVKTMGISADETNKAWLQVKSGFHYSWQELSNCRTLDTDKSESEKFFAAVNDGRVSLEATGWVEDSNGGPSKKLWPHYFRVVITPKESE